MAVYLPVTALRQNFGDVGWYGLDISQYGACTPGPVALNPAEHDQVPVAVWMRKNIASIRTKETEASFLPKQPLVD